MSRPTSLLCLAAALMAAAACSDDPISPPEDPISPPQATAAVVAKVAGDSQTTTVKSPVGVRPTVRVTDTDDNPVPGVTVTFAVTSGGGSATGAAAVSDSLGLAQVGAWILGSAAGVNTIAATVDTLPPVIFSATGIPGPAVHTTWLPGTTLVGTVGLALAVPPAVRVTDAYQNFIPGATVAFDVTAGGGTVTGDTAVTDIFGRAAVGGWVLGTVTGANTLRASVSGLPRITFTVTARSGPAASVRKLAGDGQTGSVSAVVDTLPAVAVHDAYGNLAEGVVVTFAVASGGGEVAGATPATDTTGMARVGAWALGPAPGPNTLMATITGLPPETFTATAVDRCAEAVPHAVGTTVTGTLSASDCRFPSGEFTDLYSAAASSTVSIRFDMSSPDFSSHVTLFDVNGALVASTPYWCDWDYCVGTNSVRVLIGPGDYVIGAGGYHYDYNDNPYGGAVGSYTFSSSPVPEDVTGCEEVFIARGMTTAQRIDATDCPATFRSSAYYYDRFTMQLTAGETYTISMSSTEFDTYLELRFWPWGSIVAVNDDAGGGSSDSRITFTPTDSGLYVIQAATYRHETTGLYTLVIE
jgi:hypothetical protein